MMFTIICAGCENDKEKTGLYAEKTIRLTGFPALCIIKQNPMQEAIADVRKTEAETYF